MRNVQKNDQVTTTASVEKTTTSVDNVVKSVPSDSGILNQAFISTQNSKRNWILDSGASRHVTGMSSEFTSYTPYLYSHKETIQTADGTSQPIKGVGTVQCTPYITLSSVLYVPSFLINLISLSALIDEMDCRVSLDQKNV
jgi:hypothetical protein